MEIKFDKVNFTYKKINYCEHEVLKNINIKLKAGKINAIVGKSGSGKTTLLELITGILKPTTGKVLIDEKEIDNLNNAFDIGYVSQDNNQFLQKTVKEELEMLLKLYNYKLKEKKKRINDSLIMVGLNEKYLNLNINNLSSGEKKKLALASALILNPSILIIDEPVIGLDRKTKEELKKIRTLGGIAGFPKTNESETDCFNTGHSSTSISAALGMARARDIKGNDNSVIAVIGDRSSNRRNGFRSIK